MNGRLPGLHGLRGAAAIAVVLFHVAYVPTPTPDLPPVFNLVVPSFGLGVPLFFILSAFSLYLSTERRGTYRGWISDYLVRRCARIAPLFYFMVALTVALQIHTGGFVDPLVVLQNLLFSFNFSEQAASSIVSAGWTLGVEMPFYLIFPVIIMLVKSPRAAFIFCLACVVISVASRLYIGGGLYAKMAFLSNIGYFSMGVFAYHLWKERPKYLIQACIAVTLVSFATDMLIAGKPEQLLMSASLTALVIWQASNPSRWLASNFMQWAGERSYSLYLTHATIIYFLISFGLYERIDTNLSYLGAWVYIVKCAITLSVVFVISEITYQLVERPGQRLGSAFLSLLSSTRPAVSIATPKA